MLHKHAPCDYASGPNVSHGVVHSRAKVVMQRSLDGGETWQEGHSPVWDETAPIERRMAFLRSEGPRPEIGLSSSDSAIYFGRTRLHAEENETNMETFAIRSTDRGHTWEKHPTVISSPSRLPASRGEHLCKNGVPPVRLADGYYVGAFHLQPSGEILIYGSGDDGLTWDYLSRVPGDTSGFGRASYPGLLVTSEGRLQLYTVNIQGDRTCLQLAESVDGYSWSSYRPIVRLGASPWLSRPLVPQSRYQLVERVYYRSPWPTRLRNGRIVVLFGRRKPPHGIGLIVSEDDGKTWSNEIILRDDAPSSDLAAC